MTTPVLPKELGRFLLAEGLPFPHIESRCFEDNETVRENIKSAVSRGLPEVRLCKPHTHKLSIAAGGPSLNDTMGDLTGYIGALNGSHDHLISKGIVPNACGMMDAGDIVAELITPHPDVTYFVASMCHPSVFDKLKDCHVVLWHASNGPDCPITDLLDPDSVVIGGGTTIGLRWLNLGYVCGFRDFSFHGLDSSYRELRHAYEQPSDQTDKVMAYGYETAIPLTVQVNCFLKMMERMKQPDVDPISVELHGDGLLQHVWNNFKTNEVKTC